MPKEIKYCPNCVSEMKKEKRRLGKSSEWYKCTSCGVREDIMDERKEMLERNRNRDKQILDDRKGKYNRECSSFN